MSDEVLTDDQSHYEVSLTAGQAFVAFVLLLLSLAASFAFGLMIGKGQADERLVVRKEPAVINEGSAGASKKNDGKLVDLGVSNDDFKAPAATTSAAASAVTETAPPASTITEGTVAPAAAVTTTAVAEVVQKPVTKPAPPPPSAPAVKPPAPAGPAYAQLLVTSDQKTADALAAKAIDHGFMSTYVERSGTTFKVRVKFSSEAEARASEAKLKELSKDVWIVK
ncbi:MAG TPA: SPOR domain-containing protein [Thermoanaerobaculia bacterium]|nr:SPOR domain-containing protein [Thermoanaerobaculia bacterium]